MSKEVIYGSDARSAILRGVNFVADSVRTTLGPKGQNVVIQKKFGAPTISNEDVTVAKVIEFIDPFENMGAQMVREVASKTSDDAGDGTTTATVLAQAMYREGVKAVLAGANPLALKRGMEKAIQRIAGQIDAASGIRSKGQLDRISMPVSEDMIAQVATVSANNDDAIGRIVADAIRQVGKNGVITVEESKSLESQVEVVEGTQFDHGYISPYFVTDPEEKEAVLENPYILLYEKKITALKELLPVFESVTKSGKPLLVIAEDVIGEALASLVVNKIRGTIQIAAVKTPGVGKLRKAMLQDIAVLTGGRVITKELESVQLSDLGQAKRITISPDDTTIIDGAGEQAAIQARAKLIRGEIERIKGDSDRERLTGRLSKLTGRVAVIKVGAATETEMKRRKDRVADAVHATQAALQEGVVPGGGVALIRSSLVLDELSVEAEGDERTGVNIVRLALREPLRQIASNAGAQGWIVLGRVLNADDPHFGYNALTGEFEDLVTAGVLDPTRVVRTALLNAGSVVGVLLTSQAPVSEGPEFGTIGSLPSGNAGDTAVGGAAAPSPSSPQIGKAEPPQPPSPAEGTSPPLPPGSPRPKSRPDEPQRYTDVAIHAGQLYKEDISKRTQIPEDSPLVELKAYTLEVAIRLKRHGIDAPKKAPPVGNPRRDKEDLKVYVLAKPDPEFQCIEIKEVLARITWPYNEDSDPALFHINVKSIGQQEIWRGSIEVQLLDNSLDLLDIVKVSVIVVGKGILEEIEAKKLTLDDSDHLHLVWPDEREGVLNIVPNNPQRALSIRVRPVDHEYRFEFTFATKGKADVEIPIYRQISEGDLNGLLTRIQDFWTNLVITNYADQLSVTQPTFAAYIDGLARLGMDAWSLLFGPHGGDDEGASEALGELLNTMGLGEGNLVQIVYFGTAESDFVFPWSILYPPTRDSAPRDALRFWGARYQIEQVGGPPREDRLKNEPIHVAFALDSAFSNSDLQAELLKKYVADAEHKLEVTDPINDQGTLFKQLEGKPPAHLVYFYCHGYSTRPGILRPDGARLLKENIEKLSESSPARAALETLLSLTAKMGDESWIYIGGSEIKEGDLGRQDFFRGRRPIVFLNMCQSADLLPSRSSGFVRLFLNHSASAILGTECPMTAVFANVFGKHVLDELFSGADVGTALWRARLHFLRIKNPLGLAYTLYGRATAHLGLGAIIKGTENSTATKPN